jgi:hypothetical protein
MRFVTGGLDYPLQYEFAQAVGRVQVVEADVELCPRFRRDHIEGAVAGLQRSHFEIRSVEVFGAIVERRCS